MPENNFEKQVRLKMDELQFTPSEKVWQQLEPRIREKRKRRRWMLIPFFLLTMLGSLVLYDNIRPYHGTGFNLPDHTTITDKNVIADEVETAGKSNTEQNGSSQTVQQIASSVNSSSVVESFDKGPINSSLSKQQRNAETALTKKSKQVRNKRSQVIEADLLNDVKKEPEEMDQQLTVTDKTENLSSAKIDTNSVVAAKAVQHDTVVKTEQPAVVKENEKKKKSNKWNIGFSASAGASSAGSGFMRSSTTEPLASNGGVPGLPQQLSSNETRPAFSFSAGLYAQKKITRKLSIEVALKYAFYSYALKTGDRVNTAGQYDNMGNLIPASYYYAPGNDRSLKNNFHFLQLATTGRWQLNRSASLPLYWRAGFNVQQLLSSNAVLFMPADTVFIHNNALLNKTQWGVETGLELGLFSKSHMPMTIGPEFRYHLTPFSRVSNGLRNLSYVGLRLGIQFRKK